MAVGDAAAAAGLEVVPSTQDWRLGYIRINQKGDELAAEKTARVSADALKFDKANVFIQATAPTPNIGSTGTGYSGRFWIVKA